MAQLTCELCGSTNFAKQDGFFVCGECGMKYSLAEARNMVSGRAISAVSHECAPTTVTTPSDQLTPLQKRLINARHAMSKEDWQDAERHYDLAEQIDPNNIEAIFYSAYVKLMQLLLEADRLKREAACKILINCMPLISENYTLGNTDTLIRLSDDIFKLINSKFVYTEEAKAEEETQMNTAFANVHTAFATALDNIIHTYGENEDITTLSAIYVIHCLEVEALQKTQAYQKAIAYLNERSGKISDAVRNIEEAEQTLVIKKQDISRTSRRENIICCLICFSALLVILIVRSVEPLWKLIQLSFVILITSILVLITGALRNRSLNKAVSAVKEASNNLQACLNTLIHTYDNTPSRKEIE